MLIVFGYTPYPDSVGYIKLAQICVNNDLPYPMELQHLEFIWNVGAINAVVASLKLFGSCVPLMLLYALMKGMTALFLYKIAYLLSSERTAFIALIIYVLYPINYGEATSVQSELPFVFFLILSIYIYLHKHHNILPYLLAGIIMAIANWFRPMAMVFILSLLVIKPRKRWLSLIAGYALMICLIGGISHARTGRFVYQAETGWMALMQYHWNNDSHRTGKDPMIAPSNMDCVQKDSLWRAHFISWLKANPDEYVKQIPVKIIKTYVSDNPNICAYMSAKDKNKKYMYENISMKSLYACFPHYSPIQILTIYNLIYYYILMILFMMGCIETIKSKDNKMLFNVCVFVIGTTTLALVGHGEARFHTPYMPFIIICAAYFLSTKIKLISS
jgi:4-amino-4-deoxy-L-arabinose transferase-like glycosyltransferase